MPFAFVDELWRYPVKGMRGEHLPQLSLDADGIAGDRRYAIVSSGAPRGKPLLTGAERAAMLLYSASTAKDGVRVTAPSGEVFSVDDPLLLRHMETALPGGHSLSLERSDTPLTDVRPVAVLGTASIEQLEREMGRTVDARRFRANILLRMPAGFAEDELVGRAIRLGTNAVLRITGRDPRCRIVTLDPLTADADPALMKHLDRHHQGRLGVYATVLHPYEIHEDDPVFVT